jgi:hypothetical protein
VNDASGTYPAGVTLTLTAVPDPGYTFGGWLMFTGHGSPDQSLDNPLVVVTTNYVGKTLTLTPLFSPSEGPTPTTDSTPPTSTPAPPVPPAAKPDFEKSNPAININGKKKDDATFMTTGSTFRLKGLATNSVDKIRWRLADGATHTVKVKAGANWVITVGILQMGPNIVQIWGSNSQNGKESGAHKALIIRK